MTRIKSIISALLILAISANASAFVLPVKALALPDKAEDVEIYRKVENDRKMIALTFDDGPHPRYTPQILKILEEYDIKATFFIIGVNATYYPEAFRAIVNSGHEIGNHTYSHPHVSELNSDTLKSEISKCEAVIYESVGQKSRIFRPPEGMIDNGVKSVLKNLEYKIVLWDIDTRDWAHTPPQKISNNIIANISSGDIILMHDYVSYNSPTPEALKIFIPKLLEMGYQFVPISELISSS